MPTREQLESALRNADAAGDFEAAKSLANALKRGQFDQPKPQQKVDFDAEVNRLLREQAEDTGMLESFAVSMGKGLYDIGRATGLVGAPSDVERRAFEALEAERPYSTMAGEAVGQSLPFLPAGVAAGGIRSLAVRAPVMAGIGAGEGAAIVKGTGGEFEDVIEGAGVGGAIAGGAELAFPVLGRIGRKLYAQVTGKAPKGALITPDGNPTPEMQEALEQAGVSWESMKAQTQDFIAKQREGASPEEVARLAGFEELGAPALAGQVSKDLPQRKAEQALLESGSEAAADDVRSVALAQSEAFKQNLSKIVDDLGVSGEPGDIIKDALTSRRKLLKNERRAAYDGLKTATKEVDNIPLVATNITEALPEAGELRDISALSPNQYKALNDLLIEFGVEKSPEAIESATKRGIDITPLSLQNFESFRKRLGGIERSDQTGAIGVITNPIRRSLDEEIDLAVETIEGAGGDVAEVAKRARQSNVALKTEFDEKKITSRLIDSVKRGSTQPKIESSKAYQKIMAPNAPIEDLDRVMVSLEKAGPQGQKAIEEIQGRAVLDLLDSAFSAQSRQIAGARVFGATPFSKQYEKLLPKLERAFSSNPKGMAKLKNMYERAQDIIPPTGAVPKGSAGFFIDALNKIGVYSVATKVPFAREVLEIARGAGESATKRTQARKALSAKPKMLETAQMLNRDYPQLAAAMGIAAIVGNKDDSEQQLKGLNNGS